MVLQPTILIADRISSKALCVVVHVRCKASSAKHMRHLLLGSAQEAMPQPPTCPALLQPEPSSSRGGGPSTTARSTSPVLPSWA